MRYFSCRGGAERLVAKYLELYGALDQAMGEVRGGTDVPGVRLDFNLGLRLEVPEGRWRVLAGNLDKQCDRTWIKPLRNLNLH